jgi:CheY-like chemotaxis protein
MKNTAKVALVVDDSMLIRHTVCRFLEERGFEVESATNGLEALDVLRRVCPDIIITDMQMPRMTGSELITELNRRGQAERLRK